MTTYALAVFGVSELGAAVVAGFFLLFIGVAIYTGINLARGKK